MTAPLTSPVPRSMLLREIKRRVEAHAYVVDPVQVAEALLRRGALVELSPGGARSR